MTLLPPLTALLAAAVALPALLTLYFLKLRRRPVRVSSTMLWEQAVHDLQVNAPFRMIRPSWLLLLHLIILALFLLALARPAIDSGGAPSSRVFLLIDRSASMAARDMPGGESRLDAAKARAIEIAESMTAGADAPEFTVIAFANDALVAAAPTRRLAAVRAAVNAIEPTDQPGDPERALELVEALSGGSTDESADTQRPVAVLLSDGGDVTGTLISLGAELAYEPVAPSDDTLEAARGNVGITAVSALRDIDDPALVRVFVRLANTGSAPAAATVSLLRGAEIASRTAVSVPARAADGTPGDAARTIDLRDTAGGPLTLALNRDDPLPADDTAWIVLPPPAAPAILLVAPADDRGEPAPDPFLADVLDALRTRGVRTVTGRQYNSFATNDLRAFDIIVLDRVTPERAPPSPSLSFGAILPSLLPEGVTATTRTARDAAAGFVSWTRAHPVTQDLALDAVQVSRWIELPSAGDTPTEDTVITELALGPTGPFIIEAQDAGVPRIVVAFPLQSSNWTLDFSFPIFVASAVDELAAATAGGDRGLWFPTTAAAQVRGLGAFVGAGEEVALDPVASTTDELPRERTLRVGPGGGATIDLGIIPRAGLYEVAARGAERLVAINLAAPGESALTVRREIDAGGEPAPSVESVSGPREIWSWFVLAAAALLALEWLVYGSRMRV